MRHGWGWTPWSTSAAASPNLLADAVLGRAYLGESLLAAARTAVVDRTRGTEDAP